MSWFANWFSEFYSSTWFNQPSGPEIIVDLEIQDFNISIEQLTLETENRNGAGKPFTNEELLTLLVNNIVNNKFDNEVILETINYRLQQKNIKIDANKNVEQDIVFESLSYKDIDLDIKVDYDNVENLQTKNVELQCNDIEILFSCENRLSKTDFELECENLKITSSHNSSLKENKLNIEQFKIKVVSENFKGEEQEIEELITASYLIL